MYIYIGDGPAYYNVVDYNIIGPLKHYWWAFFLFVQNVVPWVD